MSVNYTYKNVAVSCKRYPQVYHISLLYKRMTFPNLWMSFPWTYGFRDWSYIVIVQKLVPRCCAFSANKRSKVQNVANTVQISDSSSKMLQIISAQMRDFSSKMQQITNRNTPDWNEQRFFEIFWYIYMYIYINICTPNSVAHIFASQLVHDILRNSMSQKWPWRMTNHVYIIISYFVFLPLVRPKFSTLTLAVHTADSAQWVFATALVGFSQSAKVGHDFPFQKYKVWFCSATILSP